MEDLRAEVPDSPESEQLVAALRTDHRTAKLSSADLTMLDYAVKLTLTPSQATEQDIETLRAEGFDDVAIHDIVQVVALFAYYNRLADGLGIDPEPEWGWTGRSPAEE